MEDPVVGSCRNFSNRWFYNRNNSRCEAFTWSCSEHENKFITIDECEGTCTRPENGYTPAGNTIKRHRKPNRNARNLY